MDTDVTEDAAPLALRPAPLPVTLTDRHPFSPATYFDADGALPGDALVYVLRYPDESSGIKFRAECRKMGARDVSDAQLLAARREAAVLVIPEEEQARYLNALDRYPELVGQIQRSATGEIDKDLIHEFGITLQRIGEIDNAAAGVVPELDALLAAKMAADEIRYLRAAAYWLDGVTTAGDESYGQVRQLERDGMGRVKQDELECIPLGDRFWIGQQALRIRRPTPAQKKS